MPWPFFNRPTLRSMANPPPLKSGVGNGLVVMISEIVKWWAEENGMY